MSDSAASWVCDRSIHPGEQRRQIPMASTDPKRPPTIAGIACMGCYRGREQTCPPVAVAPHDTSRLPHTPVLGVVS